MTVGNILEVTTDYTKVMLYDLEDNLLAQYNGKDSIDPKFNQYHVWKLSVSENILYIFI